MYVLSIILICLSVVIYFCAGIVCGMICVEIMRKKNTDMNEVLWFWAGFLLNFIAVFMTFAVKEKNDDGK